MSEDTEQVERLTRSLARVRAKRRVLRGVLLRVRREAGLLVRLGRRDTIKTSDLASLVEQCDRALREDADTVVGLSSNEDTACDAD